MQSRILRSLLFVAALGVSLLGLAAAPAPQPQPPAPPPNERGNPPPAAPPEFVTDQILVRFQPSEPPERVDQILAERGVARVRHLPALGVHVLRLPPGLSVERAIEIFSGLPQVEFAEPNYIVRTVEVNDPGLAANQWAPQAIGAPEAWASVEGVPAVVIAVIDTGVDYRHSELSPNVWEHGEVAGNGLDDDGNGYVDDVVGWDFVNGDGDPLDDNAHGTHVAGIAAAAPTDNLAGMVGICPRCRIMAIKVLAADGSGTLDAAASGITYAVDNGARVINMSFGAPVGTSTLAAAVDYAWNHGVLPVAAAGNNGADVRLYPAAYPNAMAVAATNASDYHSCFSNYGEGYLSVSAPGEAIYSTTPLDSAGNDTYATYSGTSMATPHVSGLAGLLFSQDQNRTNADVRALIESTAADIGPTGADAYFGSGRIHALRAIQGDTSPTTPPAGLFTDSLTASGYPNARKLARDAAGTLHLAWHGRDGGQYRVLYASSADGGATWSAPVTVLASTSETFHPSLAVDQAYVYIAFPSKQGSANYQIFFTRRALSGGDWSAPAPIISGAYNAVRPSLAIDPATGRLHVAASSFDDAPYVYYSASGDQGGTWEAVRQVNVATVSGQHTRFAAVHANGQNTYLLARTIEPGLWGLISRFRLVSLRSLDGGVSWSDLAELAAFDGSEYGFSLSGVGDRLYLGYEHGGTVYFRRSDGGASWSAAESLGAGHWPSLAQEGDGQAWLAWESEGSLSLRHYNGSAWDAAETVHSATALSKSYYPNLGLGASGGSVEWVASHCSGAPFRLTYGSRALAEVPLIPQLQFSSAAYAAGEGDGAVTVTVLLNGSSAAPVTVSYATSNGSAAAGSDYTTASGTLTFNPGETSQTFTVALRDDTTDEPDEDFALTLSSPVNAVLGAPSTALVAIADNDAPPVVSLNMSATYAQENAGAVNLTVRLSAASAHTVTVDYATSNGTAAAGSDFAATAGTLSFSPGQTYQTISVPILDDGLAEPNETFSLALSNPANAVLGTPATTTITLWANDTVTVGSSVYYIHENAGQATVMVRLNAPASVPVTVDYATSNGTAAAGSDYSATSGTLTFEPGQTTKSLVVPILEDGLSEANETLRLDLSNPANAQLGTPAGATLTIWANDTLSLGSSYVYVHESAGSAAVTVRLNAPSSTPVTVDYAMSGGTATAGSDYTAVAGTLTFNPGETTKTIAVPIVDDSAGEPNETATLSLSNAANATLGTPASATLTIWANDTLSLSSSSYSVHENAGQATITVRLSGPAGQPVTVSYATANGSAVAGSDYTATSGTLTFDPGQTTRTFTVPIADDTAGEGNETISLSLSGATNATLGAPSSATLTVWANDTVTLGSSAAYIHENAGQATLTLRLSGPSSQPVTVDYTTADGTAVAGSDYTAASGTVTFSPGQTWQTITVPIVDDTAGEGNESFSLRLSNVTNAVLGTPASATLTIWANDTLSFYSSYVYVYENAGSATVTVRLNAPSSVRVTVDYASTGGSATVGSDYTAVSGTLVFEPGQTLKSFTVPILEDALDEPNETVTLALSNPVNAVLGTPTTATVTIRDND